MCTSTDKSQAILISNNNTKYGLIDVSANSFPGVTAKGTISIKVTGTEGINNGIVELKDKTSLPTCTNSEFDTESCKANDIIVNYCIKSDIIYKSSNGMCTKLTADLPTCDYKLNDKACSVGGVTVEFCKKSNIIYRSNGNKCIELTYDNEIKQFSYYSKEYIAVNPEVSNNVSLIYQCSFDVSGIATKCELAQGIIKTTTKIINCNGWKGDICTVKEIGSSVDCSDGIGDINSGATGICFGSTEVSFPNEGFKYVAFTVSDINSIYGITKEIALLKMTANSVLITSYTSEDEIYLIDQSNTLNDDNKKPLIKCNSSGCEAVKSGTIDKTINGVSGIAHTYYIDGDYPLADHIITCTQTVKNKDGTVITPGACVSDNTNIINYYVDSATKGNLIMCNTKKNSLGYRNLPTCENEENDSKKCIANALDNSYCVKKGKLFISKNDSSCNLVKTCVSNLSLLGLYKTGGSTSNEKIILCDKYKGNSDITCEYYEDIDTSTECDQSSKEGKIGFIVDTGFKICINGKAENLNTNNYGYILMNEKRSKNIFNGATKEMLIVTNGDTMIETTIKDGYYLDAISTTGAIIKCTEQKGCESIVIDDVFCTPGKIIYKIFIHILIINFIIYIFKNHVYIKLLFIE